MASITFTAGTKTKTYTVTSQSVTRIQTWALAAYPTIPNFSFNPALPENPVSNPRTIPNPDPVISVFDGLFAGLKNNVRAWEDAQARAAVVPVGDLT